MDKRSEVVKILEEYRRKPPMDDLNPMAWESVFLKEALSQLKSVVESMMKVDEGREANPVTGWNAAIEAVAEELFGGEK